MNETILVTGGAGFIGSNFVLDWLSQAEAEHVMRRLAREEGIFCGVSSGGSVAGMLRLSQQVENAVMVAIICDRGDRYLSTGVFPA